MQTQTELPAIIVLSGPPGSGKTTVAERLAEGFNPCAVIDGDLFFRSVRRGWIPPWEPIAHAQNEVVIRAIGAASRRFVEGGYVVIVDGVIGPWFLPTFLHEVEDVHVHYVVLRPSRESVMTRALGRSNPALVDPEPIEHMYDAFLDLGEHERSVIDSTHLTIEETIEAISQGF